KEWPKKPHVLSGHLTRLAPNLRRAGIFFERHKEDDKKRSRRIRLWRSDKTTSNTPGPDNRGKTWDVEVPRSDRPVQNGAAMERPKRPQASDAAGKPSTPSSCGTGGPAGRASPQASEASEASEADASIRTE